ncbi:MAG: hypothetical protein GY926_26820 [bacterium]|nr:hypothetical protein [bacterium]
MRQSFSCRRSTASLDLLAGNRTEDEALTALDYRLDRILAEKPDAAVLPDPSTLGTDEAHPAR